MCIAVWKIRCILAGREKEPFVTVKSFGSHNRKVGVSFGAWCPEPSVLAVYMLVW